MNETDKQFILNIVDIGMTFSFVLGALFGATMFSLLSSRRGKFERDQDTRNQC